VPIFRDWVNEWNNDSIHYSLEFGVRGSEFRVRGSPFTVRRSVFGVRGAGLEVRQLGVSPRLGSQQRPTSCHDDGCNCENAEDHRSIDLLAQDPV
jgi:hypothetical protein